MSSLIYASLREDIARGAVDFDTDSFKMMLVTSAYAPDKNTHNRRDDVTDEVTGAGYSAGGVAVSVSISGGGASSLLINFAETTFGGVTLTARAGVIYKSRGGAAADDELIYYHHFGGDLSPDGISLIVAATSIAFPAV